MRRPRSAIAKLAQLAAVVMLVSGPGLSSAGQLVGDIQPRLNGQALVKELKKGGHVIYFRHGATADFGEKDVADTDLENCTLQRNLSAEGQAQTKAIGDAFRRLQIPVGNVYASPYCRCLDTAKNIFGKGEKSRALHFAIHLRHADRVNVTTQLLGLLGTSPQPGTNTAMVSHTANLQEAVGIWPKPEGVAHIFKPSGDGNFTYVGMVLPDAWQQEAALAAGARDAQQGGWLSTLKSWLGSSR